MKFAVIKNIFYTTLLIFFMGASLASLVKKEALDDGTILVKSEGIEIIVQVSDNTKSYVELKEKEEWLWGTDGDKPKKRIKKIILILDQHEIKVPEWVFSDLFEPIDSKFSISKQTKHDFLFRLQGGDAAGAYEAELFFRGGIFVERVIIIPDVEILQKAEELKSGKKLHPREYR